MRRQKRSGSNAGSLDLDFGKDRALRRRVYVGALAALALFGVGGGWASNAELTGAIVAQGQVHVDKDLRAIQHLDGGIIGEILVKKGDAITVGQTLFKLDATQTRAELTIIETQLIESSAKQARLVAERDGLKKVGKPSDKFDLKVKTSDAMEGELRLFQGNFKAKQSEQEQLTLSLSQIDSEMTGLEAQLKAQQSEMGEVEKELKKVLDLKKKGLIDNSRVYATTRDFTRLEGEVGNIEANMKRAAARRKELNVGLKSIDEKARNDAQKQLSELEPRIAELEQRHSAITDKLSRMEIKSPLAGTINEIAVNTIGGVITPAQKLLTVVPENSELQVEVRLMPSDIDQVFVGQKAKLRFSSFATNETPELAGEVEFVSPATTTDPNTGQVYYTAQMDVSEAEFAKLGGKKLLPGMPVDAFIQTEGRTVLSYLAKPVTDQFAKAFREQ